MSFGVLCVSPADKPRNKRIQEKVFWKIRWPRDGAVCKATLVWAVWYLKCAAWRGLSEGASGQSESNSGIVANSY